MCLSCVQMYFRHARQALNTRGGILVVDLLGGHAAESTVNLPRHNEVTGAHFVWEQEGYNAVTRHIRCYIHLRDPATRKVIGQIYLQTCLVCHQVWIQFLNVLYPSWNHPERMQRQ